MTFSESREESPDVGSSTNRIAGSRINSSAIFSLFLCPPLMILLVGEPTLRSFFSNKPRLFSVLFTTSFISLSDLSLKQSLALKYKFLKIVSSSISRSSCGIYPIIPFKSSTSL